MHGCGQRSQEHRPARAAAPAPRRPGDRISDADRRHRTDLVQRAFADGLLEADELEAVLEASLRARTAAELDAATAVLPGWWLAEVRDRDAAATRAAARRAALRGEVRAYLGVITLLVVIWAAVAITSGALYFWPIWPALGWGIPLLVQHGAHRGRRERTARPAG